MPFQKAQSILKKIIPEKQFNSLYNVACNVYDKYVHFRDRTFFVFPLVRAYLAHDSFRTLRIHKILTIQKALPYTMVSKIGLDQTYRIAWTTFVRKIDGSFVECGVARGGCALILASVAQLENKGRKTWLFDSFEGLPEQSEKDGIQKPIRFTSAKLPL